MSTRDADRGSGPGIIAVAAAILAIAVFLPWYTADVAPRFAPSASSGWDASVFARVGFALAIITVVASGLIHLSVRGSVALDAGIVRTLAWACFACALAATTLVAWRLVRPPGPAEFLARDVGIFIAQVAAIVALVTSIGAVRPRPR
ncbi:MAG: hypothetical protein EXQ74_00875 [Thermoleophilia bacterium]|nr:hypothetical protein [Thermoleophilia bacterium]